MRALLPIGIVVAAAAGAWWLAGREDGRGTAAERPEPAAARRERAGDLAQPDDAFPAPTSEPEREALAEPPPPPAPPEPEGLEDGAKPKQPELDFSESYARYTYAEMESALANLDAEVRARLEEIANARIEQGRFESVAIEPGDRRTSEELLKAHESADELRVVRVAADADGAAPARPSALQIVSLGRAEYPELYALAAERDWLRKFLVPNDP
jgi:hypothetical protein